MSPYEHLCLLEAYALLKSVCIRCMDDTTREAILRVPRVLGLCPINRKVHLRQPDILKAYTGTETAREVAASRHRIA